MHNSAIRPSVEQTWFQVVVPRRPPEEVSTGSAINREMDGDTLFDTIAATGSPVRHRGNPHSNTLHMGSLQAPDPDMLLHESRSRPGLYSKPWQHRPCRSNDD